MLRLPAASINLCAQNGIHLVVYQTLRTLREQAIYYSQGRILDSLPTCVTDLISEDIMLWKSKGLTKGPGPKVTNALPDEDAPHIMGVAYDAAPEVFGRVAWSDADLPKEYRGNVQWDELWAQIGALGESTGLLWGNAWGDKPHFQRN